MKRHPTENNGLDQQRIDNWLWVSRFYRSRNLANDAVSAGHVTVNGNRSKPGRSIKSGDVLTINKNHQQFTVTILKLSKNRLGATDAATLYVEDEQSKLERENKAEMRRNNTLGIRFDRGRPDKRTRRAAVTSKQNY